MAYLNSQTGTCPHVGLAPQLVLIAQEHLLAPAEIHVEKQHEKAEDELHFEQVFGSGTAGEALDDGRLPGFGEGQVQEDEEGHFSHHQEEESYVDEVKHGH